MLAHTVKKSTDVSQTGANKRVGSDDAIWSDDKNEHALTCGEDITDNEITGTKLSRRGKPRPTPYSSYLVGCI